MRENTKNVGNADKTLQMRKIVNHDPDHLCAPVSSSKAMQIIIIGNVPCAHLE